MLRKLPGRHAFFSVGQEIFLVTRSGEILEGYRITAVLDQLVSLDRSPIEGSDKQGFTINRQLLKPNWCDGRKFLYAGCTTWEEAEILAAKMRGTSAPDRKMR